MDAVIARCNDEPEYSETFIKRDRLRQGFEQSHHLKSQITMQMRQGLSMKVVIRGVTPKEFFEVRQRTPASCGRKLELLPHPYGRSYWGILVPDDCTWGHRGVIYSLKRTTQAAEDEFHMPVENHLFEGQEVKEWAQLTEPGKNEPSDIR